MSVPELSLQPVSSPYNIPQFLTNISPYEILHEET